MAIELKDIFAANQAQLRERPQEAVATLTVSTRQVAGLRSEARIRDFRITVDEPHALGGTDSGPKPTELILAALGVCQEVTYRLYAESLGIPLSHVSVKVEGRSDLRGLFGADDSVRPGFRDVRAVVEIESPASSEEIERLRQFVDAHCPVLDILRNVTPTKLDVVHISGRQPVAA